MKFISIHYAPPLSFFFISISFSWHKRPFYVFMLSSSSFMLHFLFIVTLNKHCKWSKNNLGSSLCTFHTITFPPHPPGSSPGKTKGRSIVTYSRSEALKGGAGSSVCAPILLLILKPVFSIRTTDDGPDQPMGFEEGKVSISTRPVRGTRMMWGWIPHTQRGGGVSASGPRERIQLNRLSPRAPCFGQDEFDWLKPSDRPQPALASDHTLQEACGRSSVCVLSSSAPHSSDRSRPWSAESNVIQPGQSPGIGGCPSSCPSTGRRPRSVGWSSGSFGSCLPGQGSMGHHSSAADPPSASPWIVSGRDTKQRPRCPCRSSFDWLDRMALDERIILVSVSVSYSALRTLLGFFFCLTWT